MASLAFFDGKDYGTRERRSFAAEKKFIHRVKGDGNGYKFNIDKGFVKVRE